ncbi:hypothetical protein MJO28_001031 [Puccinia striiformis f. sp. tritici]|uniref:Uncharacterized protein n=3 Tax=Puccinia striiformis TaxID=27350 RepID=A0A0L0UVV0_9BASI|nr:hypothetical protein Pst134EA_000221 [Puccinia striiformis f. sp. tritici]KAI9601539.1 hypothetical protein H4Q26_001363 [Puccinia striiformis f. sp. tritici PST-130]KNE91172.1 hypothetical protein PSTG_15428 [Puccinia striiformis f. sp. tritici PST-78]POW23311.1 hypothetical protein PSHT_00311 [Puccinia striiformis]KAH9466356.1 hypothetical protein Pst134EB_001410 [Puccinia striiformis f. sp. tritici]KAH9466379.1 hypothetical protein Pst134EB_001432 [Puccinia striiformis f. sp. tritici]
MSSTTTSSTTGAIAAPAAPPSRSEKQPSTQADDQPPNKLAEHLAVGSSSPWPAWSMSGLLMASLPTTSRLSGALFPTGLAPTWQVTPLAMVFGLSGYITSAGDFYNGSGTTSAWSFIYLFLYGRDSWRHTFARPPRTKFSPFPISLSAFALTNGIIHGYVYWSGFYPDQLKDELEKTKESS